MRNPQHVSGSPVPPSDGYVLPQEHWLDTQTTQLVTFTLGGNDAYFDKVMTECFKGGACQQDWQAKVEAAIRQMGQRGDPTSPDDMSLIDLYERVAADAPRAKIVVMGYPRFFPVDPPGLCFPVAHSGIIGLISRNEMRWINKETAYMDQVIQDAVTIAQQDGKNVQYVAGSYDAFKGHEICTGDPYYSAGVLPIAASFHPNAAGNQRMAELVYDTYTTTTPLGTSKQGPTGPTRPVGPTGPTAATGPPGTTPLSAGGPATPSPIGSSTSCSKSLAHSASTTTCTVTYAYASLTGTDATVIATARVRGHTRVLARGHLNHEKLTLTFRQLRRGRYPVTFIDLGTQGKSIVIGRTTLVIT
jgi:lysophospholipase L1-like esterase